MQQPIATHSKGYLKYSRAIEWDSEIDQANYMYNLANKWSPNAGANIIYTLVII